MSGDELAKKLRQYDSDFHIVLQPGHVQRGGACARDRVLASRTGAKAPIY